MVTTIVAIKNIAGPTGTAWPNEVLHVADGEATTLIAAGAARAFNAATDSGLKMGNPPHAQQV